MAWTVRLVLGAVAVWTVTGLTGVAQSATPASESGALAARGKRFYLDGIAATGVPVAATVQGDLRVESTVMPCVNCHRRSGWGTAEGPVTTPGVTADMLFAPITKGAPQQGPPRAVGAGTRPAYTEATLLRALRDGIDPAGRTLSPTMPRYEVSAADTQALVGYLRELSERAPAGVTDSEVHLATIVTPAVSGARRSAMLEVLRAFVVRKNGGTRHETRRRERGGWDMAQFYENYRDWVLHVWELRGTPDTWAPQLEALYEREPVFAIVSGLADDWAPVHAFAARHRVPVVLPQTALPPPSGDPEGDFYSLYFSGGLRLEAATLAHYLGTSSGAPRVVQVSRCGSAGSAAATAFAASAEAPATVRSECLERSDAITPAVWRRLVGDDADALVAWLGSADRAALEALAAEPAAGERTPAIYLSSSLLGDEARAVAARLGARAALVHPFVPPDALDTHAWRALVWMKTNQIVPADRQVAVNAMFAMSLIGDSLSIPGTLLSREYFIERMEHMASRSPMPSAYPRLSFDFTRRFGSLGCYVLKAPASPGEVFTEVEPWFVPGR